MPSTTPRSTTWRSPAPRFAGRRSIRATTCWSTPCASRSARGTACGSLHPQAHELLDILRGMGLKSRVCVQHARPAPDPARGDGRRGHGARRADAIVLSSELGYRKPSPLIYRAATEALDLDPARTLFVGDRVLEDVVGPKRAGMTAVLAEWFRDDEGDHRLADHRAKRPAGTARDRRRGLPTAP